MDKVLVIIVTYNAHDWIHQCLNSVDMERYDAFVVDNASTDDTRHILKTEYPKAIVRLMDKNLGFGQANNIGLRYALDNGYDYVFLLNQDAWLLPDTIEKLIAAQKQHPEYWVLSPLQMNTAQGGVEKQFNVYCKKNKIKLTKKSPQSVDFVNAAVWLMPIECIRVVGGFDSIFPHYGEDVDYAQRVRYRNHNVGIVSYTIAYHERVVIEVSKTKLLNKTQLGLMTILLDINRSLIGAKYYVFYIGLRILLKGLIKREYEVISVIFNAVLFLQEKYYNILEHRNMSKSNCAYL